MIDDSADVDDVVHFIVREGDYTYPIATSTAGWGSTVSGTRSAHVFALRQRAVGGPCYLLAEAELRTDPAHPSRNALLFHRARETLLAQGCLALDGRPTDLPGAYRVPVVGPSLRARRIWFRLASIIRRAVRRRSLRSTIGQWSIGLISKDAFKLGPKFPWHLVHWIPPPVGGFIADPFVVDDGVHTWLFYERLLFSEGKGTLWVARVDRADGSVSEPREALRTQFHLSFPHVFNEGKDWFLLPEQARSGSTTLFRAIEFPHRWERYRDVLRGFPGIDPILFLHEGKWWLFVTFGLHPCNENNLHLFVADSLGDEFVAHPMNPIKLGLRGSRMAGPIWKVDGKLVRLGQDCTQRYGRAVVLFEILQLSPDAYAEREMYAWNPDGNGEFREAFHTFSISRRIIAIDGQRA